MANGCIFDESGGDAQYNAILTMPEDLLPLG